MELNLGRIGPYLSDRFVVVAPPKNAKHPGFAFRKADTWWDWLLRVVSWIYTAESYSDENRKTVRCFREFITVQVGAERLKRICSRYDVDLGEMERLGSPLLSRDIAKITTGIQDVKTEDIEEAILLAKHSFSKWPLWLSNDLRTAFRRVGCAEELSAKNFAKAYKELKYPARSFSLPKLGEIQGGSPSEALAYFFFNQFLSDRERLSLQEENPRDEFEVFAHNFACRIMRREMEVGMLVPAPSRRDGTPQFYRVAARLITGEGSVSYCLAPATKDTNLEMVQFYRGTSTRPGELDAASSVITDLEPEIGQTAWQSGEIYRPLIKAYLPPIKTVVGHSLGSTLAQRDTAENPDIRKAYLLNGPGLSQERVEQFNARMNKRGSKPLELWVWDADRDDLSAMGRIHLGWKAPSHKVKIHYRKYFAMNKVGRSSVHTTVWGKAHQYHGIEGGYTPERLNSLLNHKEIGSFDWIREPIGPCLAKIFRVVRDFFRWIFGSRTDAMRGLQIGVYEPGGWIWGNPKWTVKNIGPREVTHAMAEFHTA